MWPSLLTALLAQSGSSLDDRLGVGSTLYDALGVTHDCTQGAIKAAYRRCALKHHPDKVRGSLEKRDAQRRFERINEAYSTLLDPTSRQQYNSELRQRSFGGAVPRHHHHQARSAQPRTVVRLSVRCTLEELGGWSAVRVDVSSVLGAPHPPIRYWLPPGCSERERVRLPLYGGVDLELDLAAAPHRAFARHSEDAALLFCTQLLPAYHRLLPSHLRRRRTVRTVCGARVQLNSAGDRLGSGEVRRLRGFGMPRRGTGERPWSCSRGDLLVQVELASPRATALRSLAALGAGVLGGKLIRTALGMLLRRPSAGKKLALWTGYGRPIRLRGDPNLYVRRW